MRLNAQKNGIDVDMEDRQNRLGTRPANRLIVAFIIVIVSGTAVYAISYHPQATLSTVSTGSTTSSISTGTGSSSGTSQSSSASVSSSTSTGQDYTTAPPAPCTEPYKLPASNTTTFANGTSVFQFAEPVFAVGAGSTMDVCILFWDYYTQGGVNLNYSSPPSLNATLWPGYAPGKFPPPPAINVTVTSPQNFSLDTNQSIVVEYKISTGENSTGFDGLGPSNSIPYSIFGCRSIPLAVGYSPSQVNTSDFPNYPGVLTCDMPPLIGYIIGYTGGSVVYLTEENRG